MLNKYDNLLSTNSKIKLFLIKRVCSFIGFKKLEIQILHRHLQGMRSKNPELKGVGRKFHSINAVLAEYKAKINLDLDIGSGSLFIDI